MKKFIFTDFDGVMFDTLKEAYILCRWAYRGELVESPILTQEYDLFYRYKFLVCKSWQYYYLIKLIESNNNEQDYVTEYNNLISNRDTLSEQIFEEKYYSKRADLMNNHRYFWDRLETPFPFALEINKRLAENKTEVVIVSQKDKPAIEYRLSQNNISIPSDKIFGKDELAGYETKVEFIVEYMKTNGIESAYFVDDNSTNLAPCKKYSYITPLLAGWGNIGINESGLSSNEIFELID